MSIAHFFFHCNLKIFGAIVTPENKSIFGENAVYTECVKNCCPYQFFSYLPKIAKESSLICICSGIEEDDELDHPLIRHITSDLLHSTPKRGSNNDLLSELNHSEVQYFILALHFNAICKKMFCILTVPVGSRTVKFGQNWWTP